MLESREQFWWENITGPSQLIQAIVSELRDGRSVFLSAPDDLPWRSQMRSAVERALRENTPNILVDYIDCQDDCQKNAQGEIDAATFLLDRYASPDVKNGYRRSSGKSIQAYILNHHVLRDRVIWVKGMSPCHVENWLSYCREHRAKSTEDGIFVIECHEDSDQRRTAAGMKLLFYTDYVSHHDAFLFNTILAAPLKCSPEWKQYLSTAISKLCGRDAELAASVLEAHGGRAECELLQLLDELSRDPQFERRFHAGHLDDRHPFALIRSGRRDDMTGSLWETQLQVLFPLLEYERIEFIRHFYDAIQVGLKEPYLDPDPKKPGPHYIKQLGERVCNPFDAEIGTLYRMNHLRMYRDSNLYLLYLQEEADRNRLKLLRDMRNSIAHLTACTTESVTEFLNQYPYSWRGQDLGERTT